MRRLLPVVAVLLILGLFLAPRVISLRVFVPGLVLVLIGVLTRTAMVCLKEKNAAQSAGATYKWGIGQLFWRRESLALVLYAIVFAVLVWHSPNREVFDQPQWQRYVYLMDHPVTQDVPSILQKRSDEVARLRSQFETAIHGFDAREAWLTYSVARVLLPLLALLAIWLMVRYLIARRVTTRPGGKEALSIIQMGVIFFAAAVLIHPLMGTMPVYLQLLFGWVSKALGFKAVMLGFILSLIALGMNRVTRLTPAWLLAFALLGLSGVSLFKVGFPTFGRKPATGFYGEAVSGAVITPPLVQKIDDTRYLITFDVHSPGPHPIPVVVLPGQYLAFEEADTTSYEWLREVSPETMKIYTATVRGCIWKGQLAYPRDFRAPKWFYTLEAPAGSVIYRIGDHGNNWYPAFPPGEELVGYVQVNAKGRLWLDINDTVRQGENRYQPSADGTSCYFDNKGTARVIMQVMNEPTLAGL